MHYSKAPVAEAVIDIHVSFEKPPSIKALEAFSMSLRSELPLVHGINSLAVNFGTDASGVEVQSAATASQIGFRLSSQRNDRILQARTQGIAYSHMPPYTDWGRFLGELRPLWERYAETLQVSQITRLAVRFINRMQIRTGEDIDAYLNIGPRIPDAVSKYVIGYFSQIVIPLTSLGTEFKAIVNTGVEPGGGRETVGLLLDIDAFCEKPVPVEGDEMWRTLESLRHQKNLIFEASITDKLREMIR